MPGPVFAVDHNNGVAAQLRISRMVSPIIQATIHMGAGEGGLYSLDDKSPPGLIIPSNKCCCGIFQTNRYQFKYLRSLHVLRIRCETVRRNSPKASLLPVCMTHDRSQRGSNCRDGQNQGAREDQDFQVYISCL